VGCVAGFLGAFADADVRVGGADEHVDAGVLRAGKRVRAVRARTVGGGECALESVGGRVVRWEGRVVMVGPPSGRLALREFTGG